MRSQFRSLNARSNSIRISPWPMPALGLVYGNLGQASLAAENIKKAYDLRDRVSEREKYRISALYYQSVTGELEQATQVYELWAKSYPQDMVPPGNLGYIYSMLGQYEKGLAATEESQRLAPDATGYANLADSYLDLNRFDDVQKTIEEAQRHNLAGDFLHLESINWLSLRATPRKWSGS